MYLRLAVLGSVIGIFLATCEVHALGIAYSTVDYPGGNFTEVTGVQGNEMVGTYGSYPFMRGFVSIDGSFVPLDVPSSLGSETTPRGISASGVIAGYYTTAANVSQSFLYDGTKFATLTNPARALHRARAR